MVVWALYIPFADALAPSSEVAGTRWIIQIKASKEEGPALINQEFWKHKFPSNTKDASLQSEEIQANLKLASESREGVKLRIFQQ